MMGTMGNPTPIPLTGGQYEISAGDYRATITELGAGLRQRRFLRRQIDQRDPHHHLRWSSDGSEVRTRSWYSESRRATAIPSPSEH